MLTPMGWLHRYVRKRWRGRFIVFAEDLCPERDPAAAAAAEVDGAAGGASGGEGAQEGAGPAAAPLPPPQESAFRFDGPQDDETDGEPRRARAFRATVAGIECCVVLPDGRERRVEVGDKFEALGVTRRQAEQAAAAAARDWFVARGLWDPATVEGPPPPNISLTCVANRHRVQSRLRFESNPLVFMDLSLGGGPAHRCVLELFQHTEPQGAACFLGMLHGAAAPPQPGATACEGAAHRHLAPPAGAAGGAALCGSPFDCVLPSLLMAVGGMPLDAEEIAVSPQERAIARARQEQREEQEREQQGPARGEEGGGRGGGRGRGRFGGRDRFGGGRGRGRYDGGGRFGGGRGAEGGAGPPPAPRPPAAAGSPGGSGGQHAEGAGAGGGEAPGNAVPVPPPRNRYEQRFDRPFLVAIERAMVDGGGGPAAGAAEAPSGDGAASQGPQGPHEPGPDRAARGGAPAAAEGAGEGAAAPAALAAPRFFISLAPSRELQERHLAVGHVLAGFGALKEAAAAVAEARAERAAAEQRRRRDGPGAAPAGPPAAEPACRVMACGQLATGEAPPEVSPVMLGPWPAWPEDLPLPPRPDMEAEAVARLALATGIKAAGNDAHSAGDLARAAAHYRQGIRQGARLISFKSDLMGAPDSAISYDTSLPMWEAELALRLNLAGALTGLDRGSDAAEVLRELRHKVPSNAKMWYRLGQAHAVQGSGHLPDALEALTKAAELAPGDAGVQCALRAVRGRIARGQAATKALVSRGVARALGGGLYGSERGAGAGAADAPAGPDGDGDGAPRAGKRAGGGKQPPRVPEELAADVVGRHLGLHLLQRMARPDGSLPPSVADPVAQSMAAWFKPRDW
ncbi:MAG: hypothetical protein J3K34DRAFT_463807 [Monoraphidium minutum]|nr:MAG: hypothetical protein J3K34DRAFT_463807 [Monoraphidium minutum]